MRAARKCEFGGHRATPDTSIAGSPAVWSCIGVEGLVALTLRYKSEWASLLWDWSYTGTGVRASGTFTTDVNPDAHGFYQITGITGSANGGTITGLQPTGTAIPGNSGYRVDNLVSSTGAQLTEHGFGFSVSNGEYHNPFYNKDHFDYISLPPYVDGAGAEPTIHFTAAVR
jgi:hypothetical protein